MTNRLTNNVLRFNEHDSGSHAVRALQRGLDVLHYVNASGGIRAGTLARLLKLPRPTVYRLLQTLEELGYVERTTLSDLFCVTRKAASLGDGYDAAVPTLQHAGPIILELGKRLVWPVDLTVYENAAMVIQQTTHARSPMSIDYGMTGRRLPILRSSAGRAYVSFCQLAERQVILRHLSHLDEPGDRPFLFPAVLSRMITETRTQKFAIRDGDEFNPRTATLAVPIVRDDKVLGCISVIWIRTAMKSSEAEAQFVAPLQEAAAEILRNIARTADNALAAAPDDDQDQQYDWNGRLPETTPLLMNHERAERRYHEDKEQCGRSASNAGNKQKRRA